MRKKRTRATSSASTLRKRWTAKFLDKLRETGNVTDACEQAQVGRSAAYERKRTNKTFAAAWDQSLDEACDVLEREARRRAVEGVPRLKFHEGMVIMIPDPSQAPDTPADQIRMIPYVENEYSDGLLTLLLKAHRPEKFRENHKLEIDANMQYSAVEILTPLTSGRDG